MPIADLTDRAGDEAPQEGERGGRGGLGDDGGGGGRGEAGVHGVVVLGRAALALAASRAAAAEDAATPGPTAHRVLSNPIGDMKKDFERCPRVGADRTLWGIIRSSCGRRPRSTARRRRCSTRATGR